MASRTSREGATCHHQERPDRRLQTSRTAQGTSRINLGPVGAWIVLALILLTLFPFYWMLRTGLSNSKSLAANSVSLLPADFTLGAFKRVLGPVDRRARPRPRVAPVPRSTSGSTCATRSSSPPPITVGQVFFCAMAAYAFARMRWPGRDKLCSPCSSPR